MIHKVYAANSKLLKHQFLKAIDPIYLIIIWYQVTGFHKRSTRQMLIRVYLTYCNINGIDI